MGPVPVVSRSVLVTALLAAAVATSCASSVSGHGSARAPRATAAPSTATTPATTPATRSATTSAPRPAHTTPAAAPRPTPARTSLPLGYGTGDATQVITATAPSMGSTSGTVQAWQRSGTGWLRVGPPVAAWFGRDGLTTHMSETISATPVGSYTLTQAFGSRPNPAGRMPYFTTTPADWWISQTSGAGAALYNTHQRCATDCSFTQGDPNEHLYYEQPYYRYAVVIDYNTRNAPGGVRLGAGSAVFLHVSVGAPTAGCISVDEADLVRILRWLDPADHPRILIGV